MARQREEAWTEHTWTGVEAAENSTTQKSLARKLWAKGEDRGSRPEPCVRRRDGEVLSSGCCCQDGREGGGVMEDAGRKGSYKG